MKAKTAISLSTLVGFCACTHDLRLTNLDQIVPERVASQPSMTVGFNPVGTDPLLQSAVKVIKGYPTVIEAREDYKPGSAFKPFTYATALEEGWKTSDWVNDNPTKYPMGGRKFYTPKNSDGSNSGWIPLAWGLIKSKNVASVWLLNQLGPERVIQTARDMGITTNLQPFLGLTLGASEVYPIEMAQAFATFPQQGSFIESTPILYIMDLNGMVLVW